MLMSLYNNRTKVKNNYNKLNDEDSNDLEL
jgi:hypothetical protein